MAVAKSVLSDGGSKDHTQHHILPRFNCIFVTCLVGLFQFKLIKAASTSRIHI